MRTRHMTGCRAWRKRLLAHLDGELPALEQLIFEHHREECPACEQTVQFHLSIEQALHQSTGAEPDASFEDRMVAGVFERLDHPDPSIPEEFPSTPLGSRSGRSRLFKAAVAAALVLVLAQTDTPPERTTRSSPSRVVRLAPPVAPVAPVAPDAGRPGPDGRDRIVPARLSAARRTVHAALRAARDADDFRAEFGRRTAELSRQHWPLEELVVAAIDDKDPELANSAIRGVAELSFVAALPAVERATFRSRTAHEALVTLGTLGAERFLPRLERNLARPDRAESAATGLARSGSALAARVLARAATRPEQQQAALGALLSMGTPGVGELLRLKQQGFRPAAELLRDSGLPTPGQTLELLGREDDPELVLAALPGAVACGLRDRDSRLLSTLARLLFCDRLRGPVLDAIVGIGGEPALSLLLGLSGLPEPARLETELATIRILRADPDGERLAGRLARQPEGRRLQAALLLGGDELRPYQRAVFEDRLALPAQRAVAAQWLAAHELTEPGPLLAAVLELALVNETAAARLLCAAARSGADEDDWRRLDPISRRISQRLLKRAAVIAGRWAGDGLPPHPWELRQLSRMLEDTLPEL